MKWTDLKVYGKFLSRNKLYTFVSVAGLSLSLTFVILLGLYVRQELSLDRFHEKKDRIYLLSVSMHGVSLPMPLGEYLHGRYPEVENYMRFFPGWNSEASVKKMGEDGYQSIEMFFADTTFFTMFSFPLERGDPQTALRDENSVVLTRSYAHKLFGDEDPLGKTVQINMQFRDGDYTVTGIMPDLKDNTVFPKMDAVVDLASMRNFSTSMMRGDDPWTAWNTGVFLLERSGTSLAYKLELMAEDFRQTHGSHLEKPEDLNFALTPLDGLYFAGQEINSGLRSGNKILVTVYSVIAILILVMALMNYISMTVAQGTFRGKEAAIRKLIGAQRSAIFGQLLVESLLMTTAAFVVGFLLAFITEPSFNEVFQTHLRIDEQFTPATVLGTIGLIVALAVVAGIIPAVMISRFQPIEIVKGTFTRKVKSGYSRVLAVFQYFICIALLILTISFSYEVRRMIKADVGFDKERVLIMKNVLAGEKRAKLRPRLKQEIEALSGVERMSYSVGLPNYASRNKYYQIDGEWVFVLYNEVDSNYLRTYNVKLSPLGSPTAGDRYYLSRNGFSMLKVDSLTHVFTPQGGDEPVMLSGVLEEVKGFWALLRYPFLLKVTEQVWAPFWISVELAPGSDYAGTVERIEAVYSDISEGLPFESRFMDGWMDIWFKDTNHQLKLLAAFTLLAIVIMVMGVFAMALYSVRQREKEIGLRKVNGATVFEVLVLLNRRVFIQVGIAFVLATLASWFAISFLQQNSNGGLAFQLSWWIVALSGLVVFVLAVLSVTWQSWRTARMNPVKALKSE